MFMNDISIISRQMRVFVERRMSEFNLGFPELRILMFLDGCESSNQEQIATHFKVDKGSIAKSVGKLEDKQLIARSVNPDNKREKVITLNAEGRKALGTMTELFGLWSAQVYDGIDDADRSSMSR